MYLIARLGTGVASGSSEIEAGVGPIETFEITTGQAAALAGALIALLLLLAIPISRSSAELSRRALIRARQQYIRRYLRSSWAHRSGDREGHFQTLAGEYTLRCERLVQQLTTVTVASTNLVVIAVGSVLVAPLAAGLALVGLVALGFLFRPLSRRGKRGAEKFAAQDKGFLSKTAQTARVSQEIAAFAVTEPVLAEFDVEIESSASQLASIRFYQRLAPIVYQCGALLVILALISLILATDPDNAGTFGPVLLLLVRALGYARQIQNSAQAGNELVPYAQTLSGEERRLPPTARTTAWLPYPSQAAVRFESVSFEYDHGVLALADACFSIGPTESAALVGPSGAGKSTIVHLLLRLREPSAGTIFVGETDLRDIDPTVWAHRVGFVPQENKLIAGTVGDNIRFYRSGLSDDDVRRAAQAANLDDEIERLPARYDSLVGPGANELSGGQRQRLGIARALIGRPSLLVLDEPTSALDARSEALIRQTLVAMKGRVALIVIAHRQSTVDVCDRVLAVQNGRVEEFQVEERSEPVNQDLPAVALEATPITGVRR